MLPRISVLLPVYNASDYIDEAVQSILGQTLGDFELIIVDDGSRDDSVATVARHARRDRRIRLICTAHRGITPALNTAVRHARGELLARMDADDASHPDRFSTQANYLASHPEVVAVGSSIEIVDPDGEPLGFAPWAETHDEIDRRLLQGRGGIAHPAAMMRRAAVLKAGAYREEFTAAQDKDLWLRLAEIGRLANLPQPLLRYREHPLAISTTCRFEQRCAVRRAVIEACRRRGMRPPDWTASQRIRPTTAEAAHRRWVRSALRSGHSDTAWKHLRWLCRERPLCKDTWLALAAACYIPPWTAIRRSRTLGTPMPRS